MREYEEKPANKADSTRRLGLWVVALAVLAFALIPPAFNPNAVILYTPAAFYLVKFKLLVGLSAALLVAVLGASYLGGFAKIPILSPVLAVRNGTTPPAPE